MYPRAAPVARRRTLFLLRRAVPEIARTHTPPKRGERESDGGGGGKGEVRGSRHPSPINTRESSGRYRPLRRRSSLTTANLLFFEPRHAADGRTDGGRCSFLIIFLLYISTHHTHTRNNTLAPRSRAAARAHAHTREGVSMTARRAVESALRAERGSPSLLLQPGRSSRPVRGRVCHCTGTRAAANIHSSLPPLSFPRSYAVSVIDNTRRGTERRRPWGREG